MIHATYTHPGVNSTLLAISRAMRDHVLAKRTWGEQHCITRAHDRFIGRLFGRLVRINEAHTS